MYVQVRVIKIFVQTGSFFTSCFLLYDLIVMVTLQQPKRGSDI
jgi:hypothetical protein